MLEAEPERGKCSISRYAIDSKTFPVLNLNSSNRLGACMIAYRCSPLSYNISPINIAHQHREHVFEAEPNRGMCSTCSTTPDIEGDVFHQWYLGKYTEWKVIYTLCLSSYIGWINLVIGALLLLCIKYTALGIHRVCRSCIRCTYNSCCCFTNLCVPNNNKLKYRFKVIRYLTDYNDYSHRVTGRGRGRGRV